MAAGGAGVGSGVASGSEAAESDDAASEDAALLAQPPSSSDASRAADRLSAWNFLIYFPLWLRGNDLRADMELREPHERAGFAGWRPSFWPPSAPLRRKNAVCLTVVGADSISARPGRRGRRPLRMFFDKQLKGRGDAASSLRADDEHRPLHFSETVCPRRGIGGGQPPDQPLLNS